MVRKREGTVFSHGVLALLLAVSAAGHKWTSQWKWKSKNMHTVIKLSQASRKNLVKMEPLVLYLFLSRLFPALC